jgi:hypothetical protein
LEERRAYPREKKNKEERREVFEEEGGVSSPMMLPS